MIYYQLVFSMQKGFKTQVCYFVLESFKARNIVYLYIDFNKIEDNLKRIILIA